MKKKYNTYICLYQFTCVMKIMHHVICIFILKIYLCLMKLYICILILLRSFAAKLNVSCKTFPWVGMFGSNNISTI